MASERKSQGPASCFLPMLFLGVLLILLGLGGLYACSLAKLENGNQLAVMSQRIDHMRAQGILTAVLGLVISAWAFDRRITRGLSPLGRAEQRDAKGTDLRNLALGGFLLIVAAALFLQLREPASLGMRYIRRRAGIRDVCRVRSALTHHGIPFESVELDSKSGRHIYVCLEGSNVRDIATLAGLPIHHLTLRQTSVTDFSPLKKCPLWSLILRGRALDDISSLGGTSIKTLDLRETGVVDLRPLAQMPDLNSVLLSRDQIEANLDVLGALSIMVQLAPSGPGWHTQGSGWRQEFGTER